MKDQNVTGHLFTNAATFWTWLVLCCCCFKYIYLNFADILNSYRTITSIVFTTHPIPRSWEPGIYPNHYRAQPHKHTQSHPVDNLEIPDYQTTLRVFRLEEEIREPGEYMQIPKTQGRNLNANPNLS